MIPCYLLVGLGAINLRQERSLFVSDGIETMTAASGAEKLSQRALARIIKKSMRGDAKAFAELYKIFIKTIQYNVSNSLTNKSDVEDAVQQVVISLHKGLPKLKSPYAFHSYLYRITMNVCSSYNEKDGKQRHSSLEEVEEDLVDTRSEAPPLELERKENDELVRQFISKLPEKQRYALLLYYYYDMSYKDIAEVMGTTVTVVGSNINRAKKNLKRMLEEYEKRMNAADDDDSDMSFLGVTLDSMFVAGFASAVDNVLEPSAIEMLWQKCVERAPEIAVSVPLLHGKLAALRAVLAGLLAMGVVIGAGTVVIRYAIDSQAGQGNPLSVEQNDPFIPDSVSIIFSSAPDYPDTYNPAGASIELSEGFPLSWCILDASGSVVAEGDSPTIAVEVFEALGAGVYQVKWEISNYEGNTGFAYRKFTITDSSTP